jgi:hypothetical protein
MPDNMASHPKHSEPHARQHGITSQTLGTTCQTTWHHIPNTWNHMPDNMASHPKHSEPHVRQHGITSHKTEVFSSTAVTARGVTQNHHSYKIFRHIYGPPAKQTLHSKTELFISYHHHTQGQITITYHHHTTITSPLHHITSHHTTPHISHHTTSHHITTHVHLHIP